MDDFRVLGYVTLQCFMQPRSLDELTSSISQLRERISNFYGEDSRGCAIAMRGKCIDVMFSLERDLATSMHITEGREYIEVASRGRRGRVLRNENAFGLGAWTDSRDTGRTFAQPTLIVNLFPHLSHDEQYSHPHTDHGLRVIPGEHASVHIVLWNVFDRGVTPEQLVEFVVLAERRANEVIDAVTADNLNS